jgi:Metallo-peptidase family M12/Secretion system C-terminal sorting domain/HYR domain
MKNIIILFLILPIFAFGQKNRTGRVFEVVNTTKARVGDFQSFEIFDQQTRNASNNYSNAVEDGVIVAFNQLKINTLLSQDPQQMKLTIPLKSNGETIDLELVQVDIFSPEFKAITSAGVDITEEVDLGKHYRGVIAGNSNSLVSISIFETQINGFIANEEGNFTIGKLEDSSIDHIIYKDSDLKTIQNFTCATVDDGQGYTAQQLSYSNVNGQDPGDAVDLYIEAGQSVQNIFNGDITNTMAFLTGVFGQSIVLFANDGIDARISSMFVWTVPDPYTSNDSIGQLDRFRVHTGQGAFDGDLGILVENQGNVGGIASGISGICAPNTDDSLCFAGFAGPAYQIVPIYSFNVYLITHELGHLMGSRHTHACVWNGDNTAIDGCAGFTEGGCPLPPLPPGGGTIMSYCASTGVGIDFNLGFGPQPAAVILNNIDASGNCLNPFGTLIPPTAVCTNYTAVLDSNGNATIVPADVDYDSYDDIGIVTYAIDIDTFDCNDIGDNDVLLTVTDTDGLSNTCLAIVKVEDDTDPVVTNCPADFTVMVEGLYDLLDYTGVVTATDNCPIIITQDPAAGTQLPEGAHTITLTAEDGDGNEGSCSFVITVDDILGVGDNTLLSSIVMYPNPTNEIVRLINPQNLELEVISIYDLTGRLIKTVDLRGMGLEISVDLSGLASANYMVVIQGAQSLATKQLIKR